MRIALVSDIHGNLVSLKAVLADVKRRGADRIVCLGDVATLGPQPKEVVALLKKLGCQCVMGNHDYFLLHPEQLHKYMDDPWFADSIDWCMKKLTKSDFDFLRSFKPLLELPLDDHASLLCVHGSPRSNTDIILATTPAEKVDEMIAGYTATVIAGGHTHVQMMRQHKGAIIVNVGSVGMPFEQALFQGAPRILPWAEYGIIDHVDDAIGIELFRVPTDFEAIKRVTYASGMPDTDEWVSNWVRPEEIS
jgi:predicted phosphodiesterase